MPYRISATALSLATFAMFQTFAVSAGSADDTASRPMTPYERATAPFFSALSHACPSKNLQLLLPADLNFQIEKFEPTLTPDQDRHFRQVALDHCKNSIAGTGCGNVGFLEVAQQDHFMDRFVAALCELPIRCTAPAECRTD